jgi:flavin-dependent dehydrogenase
MAGAGPSGVPADAEPWKVGESLPPAVRPLLEGLGVWGSFREQGHLSSRGTSAVWGPSGGDASAPPADHDFLLSPQAEGWHLDRARFDRWLLAEAEAAGCSVWRDAVYLGHRRDGDGWRLTVRRGGGEEEEVPARRVVDATGRRAAFARREGAEAVVFDDLLAVFRVFRLPAGATPSTHALVEAVEDGWWYAARVPGDRLVAGVFADADTVGDRGLRKPDTWRGALGVTHHVSRRVEAASQEDDPPDLLPTFPAASRHLHPFSGDGWLAVGDAASCYDPLSSQGLLKALRFAKPAAYATADALAGDETAGDRYAAWVGRDFEGYLEARSEVYRREHRWPASPFWRRRHEPVTLDPHRVLGPGTAPLPSPPRHFPTAVLLALRDLCDPLRPAHEVVQAFRDTAPSLPLTAVPSARRVVLALQHLLALGAVATEGPNER